MHFIETSIAVRRRHVVPLLVSLIVSATVVLYFFDPRTTWFYPHCPFLALTGFQCPGCGTTRALHALLHGHVSTAFALNPLLFIVPPPVGLLHWMSRAKGGVLEAPRIVGWALLLLVVAFGIVRNLPGFH